jgi:hypothetical protein
MTVAGPATMVAPALESPRSPLAVSSYGPLVTAWARRRLGIDHGAWQAYTLARILECDSEGALLARQALVSVGRQNGKSVIVRSLVGWILDEGYAIPAFDQWTFILLAAHDAKQARIPYDFIRKDVEGYSDVGSWDRARRKGKSRMRATYNQGIEMNGVTVDVATRQPGSARGISPGLIAFDEVLTQTDFSMYEVLSPAQSAIKNSLMLMTSTAGFADSVILRAMHDKLYRQSTNAEQHDPSFTGLWWRADDDDAGLDWEQLKKANPALDDGRLSRTMITSEYGVLPRGSWVRERLNRWHDERVDAPFSLAAWGACRVPDALNPGFIGEAKYTIGVDVTSIWSEGSIIVSAQRTDGMVGVEVHRFLQARSDRPLRADDFTNEIVKLCHKLPVEQVVYYATSPLAPAMERVGVAESIPVVAVTPTRMLLACHDFAEAVTSRRIAHNDPHLDSQIAVAQRRFIGSDGSWKWAISLTPITSVVAMTMASMFASKAAAPLQFFL